MVVLYRFGAALGLIDMSPFCAKVETYLRIKGLPFESKVGDIRKAPKGKLPFVDDSGTHVSDSRDIIRHFEQKSADKLDAGLSAQQLAISRAFRALIEEEIYFYVLVLRWTMDDGWAHYRPVIVSYLQQAGVPGFVAGQLAKLVRRGVHKATLAQGAGRHSRAEVEARLVECYQAVIAQLGQGPYFLGDTVHEIDATVYAFISGMTDAPFESQAKSLLQGSPAVTAYCRRMRETYFR